MEIARARVDGISIAWMEASEIGKAPKPGSGWAMEVCADLTGYTETGVVVSMRGTLSAPERDELLALCARIEERILGHGAYAPKGAGHGE